MIKGTQICILTLLIACTLQCHYSCSTCTDSSYSSCTACPKNHALSKPQAYTSDSFGVCSGISINNANIFGIFLLLILVASCIIFPVEEIVHFVFLIQSIGLLFIAQVGWSQETHYILSAFSYLMFFTKVNYLFIPASGSLQSFKFKISFETAQITKNMSVLGPVNLLLVLLMVAIPVFKIVRKKLNRQRANCLADVTLSKIILCISFAYMMLIQETLLNIYFGFKYSEMRIGDQLITAIYFISLIFFAINQWFYLFPFFRSKAAQLNCILTKAIAPIFVVTTIELHFLLFIYLIVFFSIDIILTNKNRNNSSINRLFFYKLEGMLILLIVPIYYGIEMTQNDRDLSFFLGILMTISLCGLLSLFALQFCLQYKDNFCKGDNKKVLKQSQMIEMTIEEVNVPNKQANNKQYDFTSLPPQNQESCVNDFPVSKEMILPLTLAPTVELNGGGLEVKSNDHSDSAKFSEKGSSNRQNTNIQMFQNRQNVDTFEEIQVEIKEKPKSQLNESQNATIKNKSEQKSASKRKAKRRKRQQ